MSGREGCSTLPGKEIPRFAQDDNCEHCSASSQAMLVPGVRKAQPGMAVPLGFDDVVADGVVDQFGEGMEVELEHDVGTMGFGSVDGDAEKGSNFLVGFAFSQELKDFAFARGEAGSRAGGIGGGKIVGRRCGDTSREVRFMLANGINSGEENAVGVIFEDVATSAGVDDLLNEVVGFMHGEDEDFRGGRSGADAAGGFDTIEEGHADIKDGYVGFQLRGFFYGVATLGGFRADLPAGAGLP